MVESPARMAHTSSSYACAEDGYFKRPHTASIDGDIRWDGCWVFVLWFWIWRTFDTRLAMRKLGKNNTHPHHGGRRRHTAAMVPRAWHRRTQQSANMMRDKSMSLKLEDTFVFTIY